MDTRYTIDETTLVDIADAVREKTNSDAKYSPLEIPEAIRSIVTEYAPCDEITEFTDTVYSIRNETITDIASAIQHKLSDDTPIAPVNMPDAIGRISGSSGHPMYGLRIGKTSGGVILPARFNASHRVEVTFDPFPIAYKEAPIFGQDYNGTYFHIGQAGNCYYFGNGQDKSVSTLMAQFNYYGENTVVISNSKGVVFNGVKILDCNWGTGVNEKYSYSIAFRRDWYVAREFTFKSMRIYEDNTDVLLYEYVPYHIDDNAYGIYDTLSKTFIGTPPTLAEPVLKKYTIQVFDYAFFKQNTSIDVDMKYGDYRVDVDFDIVKYTNNAAIFGVTANNFTLMHATVYSNKYYIGPGIIEQSDFYSTTIATVGKHHITHNEADTHNVIYSSGDDTEIIGQYTINESILANPNCKYRVGARSNGVYFYGKIYSYVLTDNATGDILINLVPAQVSDGETVHMGMYDTVHDRFYVNDNIEVGNDD